MNRTLLALGLLSALALPATGFAQSAVPLNISYQGKVTTAAGALLGAGTPVNRQVIFRLYASPTSTTIIHAEKQTVTIADGEFSVLLGVGDPVGVEPRLALDAAFLAAQRYLGVTVDNGNDNDATNDVEISPRQQIVSTPFAFRAKVAEGLSDNAVSTATMIANNAITGVKLAENTISSSKILDLTITANDLADSSVTSAKIANGSVATVDLADASVTTAKLAADIGVWSVNGTNVHRNSNVGIGNTSNAIDRLTVSGGNVRLDLERYLAFSPGVDNFTHLTKTMPQYGVGAFIDSDLGPSAALWLSGYQGLKFFTNGAQRMVVNSGGWVGIGTTSPDDQLTVYSGGTEAAIRVQSGGTGDGSQDGIRLGTNGANAFLHTYEPIPFSVTTGPVTPLWVHPENRIGLGGNNTDANASVMIKDTGKSWPFIVETGGTSILFGNTGQAYKPGGGSWAASSDIRLKTDVQDLAGSLEKLLRLHSVTFRYKDETKYPAGVQTGFIAQEVEKIFPSWVSEGHDGFKAVSVFGFESLTVQALRELRTEKDAQIAILTARAETAEARLAALEQQVAALVAASKR
jgi:hypothetical protein